MDPYRVDMEELHRGKEGAKVVYLRHGHLRQSEDLQAALMMEIFQPMEPNREPKTDEVRTIDYGGVGIRSLQSLDMIQAVDKFSRQARGVEFKLFQRGLKERAKR